MKDYYNIKELKLNKIMKFKINDRGYGRKKFYNKKGKR